MRALVGALLGMAVGGALVLLASGRVWSTATVRIPGAPASSVSVTGHAVEPSLPALGIALLALAAAVIAARGWMRRAVGVVIVLIGGVALGVSVAGRSSVSSALTAHEVGGLGVPAHGSANSWWMVAAVGSLIALLVGLAVTLRSGQWAAMGRKYEVPQGAAANATTVDPAQSAASRDALGAWEALDRGEDPTQ